MRRYSYLSQRLVEYGIDRAYLAAHLGKSVGCINSRFAAAQGCTWTSDEQYKIMDMLGEPYSRLHIVFPKDGIADPRAVSLDNITVSELFTGILKGGRP